MTFPPNHDQIEQAWADFDALASDPYEDEPPGRAFCDRYEAHDPHVYTALNANLYRCPGLTAGELQELEDYDPGTCEHGLSADLCSGPMHYPADR